MGVESELISVPDARFPGGSPVPLVPKESRILHFNQLYMKRELKKTTIKKTKRPASALRNELFPLN